MKTLREVHAEAAKAASAARSAVEAAAVEVQAAEEAFGRVNPADEGALLAAGGRRNAARLKAEVLAGRLEAAEAGEQEAWGAVVAAGLAPAGSLVAAQEAGHVSVHGRVLAEAARREGAGTSPDVAFVAAIGAELDAGRLVDSQLVTFWARVAELEAAGVPAAAALHQAFREEIVANRITAPPGVRTAVQKELAS